MLKLINDMDADLQKPYILINRTLSEISVEGYDTCSLQKYAIKLTLRKHFASCGEILAVSVFDSVALIRFKEEDAKDKALQLSGTDVGGWFPIVKVAPWQCEPFDLCALRIKPFWMLVTGYDTCLAEIDIQIALCEHFSSCGEVIQVMVLPRYSTITIKGERCVEKAMELSGRDVGGMNFVVEHVERKRVSCKSTGYMPPPHILERLKENRKMLKEKKKKMEMVK